MKDMVHVIISVSLLAQVFLISAPSLFAHKFSGRYKPAQNTARSVGTAATTRIPYVVNPRLPVATQQRVAAFSGAVVDRSVSNRVVEAAHQVTNHTPASSVSGPITTNIHINAAAHTPVLDSGTNLTGTQVLAHYYPTWRQELGGMFSPAQLDAMERTFAATDEWMFIRGEDGELQIRNKDEWDYEARFLTLLQESGVSFTEKQIKQLVGGKGIRWFTLNQYFTLINMSYFIKAYPGTSPRKRISNGNGQAFTLTELRARVQRGDKEAEKLAAELELGESISRALQNWPKDLPEYQALKALNDANRNIATPKTPQQVLAAYKQWIAKYPGTSPRLNTIRENGKNLTLADLRARVQQGDKQAEELAAELELGQSISRALQNWPKESFEYQELKALYDANRNIAASKPTEELYQDLDAIRAAKLATKQFGFPERVTTEDDIENLLRLYNQLDPFEMEDY